MTMERVLVAMSGGVDSSVAAYLLQQQGYECVGVTMRLYDKEGSAPAGSCGSTNDVDDARAVAERLGMDFHVVDFRAEFETHVLQKFAAYYEKGWTPNPCVECNRHLKFDHLVACAEELGCTKIATGHYARIFQKNGRTFLQKGVDVHKDQSYALCLLPQEVLSRTLLPIGELEKSEVRRIAQEQGFGNAKKRDSQDICFVPDGDYVGFLERYLKKEYIPGPIVDAAGTVRGTHAGAVAYTIGQRRGLGIAAPEPLYVYDKDMHTNTVCVGPASALEAPALLATDWNWIAAPSSEPQRAAVKIRYGAKEQPCRLAPRTDGTMEIRFDAPIRAIAPGQAAVAYDGDFVIGGGTIVQVLQA